MPLSSLTKPDRPPTTLVQPHFWPYRFSVVLKSSKELTELMLLGRPPSPSSASSSGSSLVFTHTGKYFSFSWKVECDKGMVGFGANQ